ncbi:hypothetical protein U9M48_037389 [Paspalum notatum var. saurae]|uniref:Ubiquitin-like protease family profile domain-containing protein n=1 Tax=Paspalum notatum var. saurae TaxID=547442 RepID=A0AAQ3UFI1_PASNO
MGRIEIDWKEVFGATSSSLGREHDVDFGESPSPSSAKRAQPARASSSGDERPRPRPRGSPRRRFEGLKNELEQRCAGERRPRAQADDGARRPVTRACAKAAGDLGPEARSAAEKVYLFNSEDEDGEYESHKYRPKSPPPSCGKKNYGKLPLIKRRPGQRNPIPVEKMYSSQPCSAALSRKRPKDHTDDPEEPYHGKLQRSGKFAPRRNFNLRRRKQLRDSSNLHSQKVQDVVELDDDEVQCETSDRKNVPKIYYPSRDNPEVELTSSDIECLDPGQFLSSPVINYYIQYIKKTKLSSEDCREKFYIFNTYFYGKLEETLGRTVDFSKLRRWWKGVNILNKSYIILPIHGAAHWSLVIICIPGKESISGPIILHLDSLGIHSSTKILNTAGRFLEEEWRYSKQNPSSDTSIPETAWEALPRNVHKEQVQVPQQPNAYDCGIFMLYYIERFIREAPERFTIDRRDMFNRCWFKPEDASELRLRIRKLLVEEFESARMDDAMSDAAASEPERSINGGEFEVDAPSDSSEMVEEVGLELGNTGKSNEGINVAALEEESGESGDAVKGNEGIKVAALEESSGNSGDARKSIEGINVLEPEELIGESGDAGMSIEGINVADSEEASGESGGAGKSMEDIDVADSEEAREESGGAGKSMEGIDVADSEEASEESGGAGKGMDGIDVADSEEASGEPGHSGKSMKGVDVADLEEASGDSEDAGKSNTMEGINVADSEEASEESGDAVKSMEGINVADSEEASGESGDTVKSMEGIDGADSEETIGESGDAGKSMEGINVADSEEASEESGDAVKTTEGIAVAKSDEGSMVNDAGVTKAGIVVAASEAIVKLVDAGETEDGVEVASPEEESVQPRNAYKNMEGLSKVAALDAAPTSSKRDDRKPACSVLPEAVPCFDAVKGKEGAVKVGSVSSKTEKETGPVVILPPERPQNNKVVTPKAPTPDVVCDSCDSDTDPKIRVLGVHRRHVPRRKEVWYRFRYIDLDD